MRKGKYKRRRTSTKFAPYISGPCRTIQPRKDEPCVHSYLSAVIGSSFAARNAG